VHRAWRRSWSSRILAVASGLFDGLAHEPRRHGVRPARVMFPGRSGGPEVTVTDPPPATAFLPSTT